MGDHTRACGKKKCDEDEAKSPVMMEEDREDLRALNTFTRVTPESRRQINLQAYLDLWYFFTDGA